jgi:hypothetical protein
MEKFGDWHHCDVIEGWTDGAEARWRFTVLKAGRYHVYADYECWESADYSELEIAVAGLRWTFPAIYTGGGKGLRTRLRQARLGLADVPAGPAQLTLHGLNIKSTEGLIVRGVTLESTE